MKSVLVTGAYGFLGRHIALHFYTLSYEVYGIGHGQWSSDDEKLQWGIKHNHWFLGDVTLNNADRVAQAAVKWEDFKTKLGDVLLTSPQVQKVMESMTAGLENSAMWIEANSEKIEVFVQGLEKVSHAFQRMAALYLSRRVERGK